eukprot:2567689-Prymnesium_polylepis.1
MWPGGISSNGHLWRTALAGSDMVDAMPDDRWTSRIEGFSMPKTDGASYLALLRGSELFDDRRFGISSAEATWMDPQHRLLLQSGAD